MLWLSAFSSDGVVYSIESCICTLIVSLRTFKIWLQTNGIDEKVYQSSSKSFFVEMRTFWHLFRSFDRLWAFYILGLQVPVIIPLKIVCSLVLFASTRLLLNLKLSCDRLQDGLFEVHYIYLYWHMLICFLIWQAMIILAWNVGPNLQSAFNGTVVKQVLSIFITASILRLIQGKL